MFNINSFIELAKKNRDMNSLVKIVQLFDFIWGKNEIENEYNLAYQKKEFYEIIAQNIIKLKEYPYPIHKILADNLSGKSIAEISHIISLESQIISDYQSSLDKSKDITNYIDFSRTVGADTTKIQQKVLNTNDEDMFLYFVKTSPKYNKYEIESKLGYLINHSFRNAKLVYRRKKILSIIKDIKESDAVEL